MIIKSVSRFTRISPKKVRIMANEVKKMKINNALSALNYSDKKGAGLIKKALESAIANAKNNLKINKEDLFIKKIDVNAGPSFKRWIAVSKGTAHPYKRRTSNITVILEQIKLIKPQEAQGEVKAKIKTEDNKNKKEKKNGS